MKPMRRIRMKPCGPIDKAFFMKVQDIVRCAVDESRFLMTVDKMKEAMHIPLTHDPVQEVELLADTYQLNQSERGNVLRSLFMGRDLSRYGMMNAITDASKLAASYERATDMERIGGEFLMAPVDNKALKAKHEDYEERHSRHPSLGVGGKMIRCRASPGPLWIGAFF